MAAICMATRARLLEIRVRDTKSVSAVHLDENADARAVHVVGMMLRKRIRVAFFAALGDASCAGSQRPSPCRPSHSVSAFLQSDIPAWCARANPDHLGRNFSIALSPRKPEKRTICSRPRGTPRLGNGHLATPARKPPRPSGPRHPRKHRMSAPRSRRRPRPRRARSPRLTARPSAR